MFSFPQKQLAHKGLKLKIRKQINGNKPVLIFQQLKYISAVNKVALFQEQALTMLPWNWAMATLNLTAAPVNLLTVGIPYIGLNKTYATVYNIVRCTLIAKLMGPTWGPSGADRTQVGPCWPHELCYLGIFLKAYAVINSLCPICFRENIKHVFTSHVIPLHWYDTGGWNPSLNKTRTHPFYLVNIMAAGVLATQGARASAIMILT